MGYGHFPAGILLLVHRLFGPFRRYRHGDDSPEPFILFSPLSPPFECDPSPLADLPDFLTFFLISPQLSGVEPFFSSFRHTIIIHQRSLEAPYRRVGKKRKR